MLAHSDDHGDKYYLYFLLGLSQQPDIYKYVYVFIYICICICVYVYIMGFYFRLLSLFMEKTGIFLYFLGIIQLPISISLYLLSS